MHKTAKQLIAAGMSLLLIFLCASCSFQNKEVAMKMFKNRDKISYSSKYTALKESGRNRPDAWREGMVSGNGETGFITSGVPYSDSMIFQNVRFVMPNNDERQMPDTAGQLEDIKQAIVDGTPVSDSAGSAAAWAYHPGGALRITSDDYKAKKYIRYTDYETGEVGVNYSDDLGAWERKSFTSFADNAVVTRISCLSGAKTRLVLSFDDISTFANFGEGNEVDTQVRTLVDEDATYIANVGHYPDYENSALSRAGWMTFTYVIPEGGEAQRVTLNREDRAAQDVSDAVYGILVSDAYAVNLITVTRRIDDLCDFDDFAEAETFKALKQAESDLSEMEGRYVTDGDFDYEKALKAHTDIYSEQFNAISLTLEEGRGLNSNEALSSMMKGKKALDASYILRAYYAGRYAALCCAGQANGRHCGLWTGEFAPAGGGAYTASDLSIQTAVSASANLESSPVGLASFILRQAGDWEENAATTHGFKDAIQAPAVSDGETGYIFESTAGAPYRYWNAGAAMMLRPLYDAVLAFGDMAIPITDDMDLDALSSVLSLTEEDLDGAALDAMEEEGRLSLLSEVLLPLLVKTANYWVQLADPEYYTDAEGVIHYEAGKTSLSDDEYYCLLPGYTFNGTPENYHSAITANTAVDIAACRDTITMLLDVADLARLSGAKTERHDTDNDDEEEEAPADAGSIDTAAYEALLENLPPYSNDEQGGIRPWATEAYLGIGQENALSHLACAWPFAETKSDGELWDACAQSIRVAELTETNGDALARRALLAARLQDRGAFTQALLTEESGNIRYSSFMTNEKTGGRGAYSPTAAIGFTAAINEGLMHSSTGMVELLPCMPEAGFDVGSIAGLRTKSNAVITLMSWDLRANFVIADVTSDVKQTVTFSCPFSSETVDMELLPGKTKTVTLNLDLSPEDLAPASDAAAPVKKRDMSSVPTTEEKETKEKETTEKETEEKETTGKAEATTKEKEKETTAAPTTAATTAKPVTTTAAPATENSGGSDEQEEVVAPTEAPATDNSEEQVDLDMADDDE